MWSRFLTSTSLLRYCTLDEIPSQRFFRHFQSLLVGNGQTCICFVSSKHWYFVWKRLDSPPMPQIAAASTGGYPAPLAHEVVERGLILAGEALTGMDVDQDSVQLHDSVAPVKLFGPDEHAACLARMQEQHKRLLLVDYTHPTAVNANVAAYTAAGLSFVVGTTGGDESAM
eukprot:IDg10721t1